MGQRRFEARRCDGCGLHDELCVCAHRPQLSLATALLVVQNNKERHKPTNTARMLPQVLTNCELVQFGVRGCEFDPSALTRPERDYVLIFPRVLDPEGGAPEPAPILDRSQLAARRAARPDAIQTFVLLDGTWAQCSRMSRRLPELATMQAFALPEGPPSHWGVRVPSEPSRISSFEAGVRVIELAEGPGPALALQTYFDHVAAGMLFMKAKQRSPAVPEHWVAEREHRFGRSPG
ncbi:DTW domain-containing protein [Enhygromyxa salina]|uniref:tRNA-uridine aminocarboxypropyltransferase n=1 Tax=Enhygromyxa salina TaxID=215803 RepID=A0A2S9YX72_9BACT|nr:tRNA-uridine aminocarboxypropyltransferase [Enhygromyxa salina]PRQ09659.1 DTW domain protein [Enhygromyxa salina]